MKNITLLFQKLFLLTVFVACSQVLQAQTELKPVVDETSAILAELGGAKNKVKRATLTKEDERMVTISLTFEGFDDKTYQVKAFILNAQHKIIEAISPFTVDMPKSKQVDVTLNLSEPGKTLTSSAFQSKYLMIRTLPKESGLGGLLEDTIGDMNLSGTDHLFELNKSWMAVGANVKVSVTLVPYKSAASISPN